MQPSGAKSVKSAQASALLLAGRLLINSARVPLQAEVDMDKQTTCGYRGEGAVCGCGGADGLDPTAGCTVALDLMAAALS